MLSTVPKGALVDMELDIQDAIRRVTPKVAAKGWRKASSTLYRRDSGGTLTITFNRDDDRIEGVYNDGTNDHETSYISYIVDGRTLQQNYMKSYPDRVGIGTVLCYEGLVYARDTLNCNRLYVSMANKNSGPLMRKLLGEDDVPAASTSCFPCCFLVTACAEARGLPADCEELTTLRAFRDDYLRERPGGEEMIGLYYQVAPPIVQALWATADPACEFEALYQAIRHCVGLIEAADLEGALHFYREMVETLAKRFLPADWEPVGAWAPGAQAADFQGVGELCRSPDR